MNCSKDLAYLGFIESTLDQAKTISLSVEEVMVTALASKKSYFEEYEEIESSDEN